MAVASFIQAVDTVAQSPLSVVVSLMLSLHVGSFSLRGNIQQLNGLIRFTDVSKIVIAPHTSAVCVKTLNRCRGGKILRI